MRHSLIAALMLLILLAGCSPLPKHEPPLIPAPPVLAQLVFEECLAAPEERDEVMDVVNGLTIEEKVGQLVFAGYQPSLPEQLENLVTVHKVGGIILFKRNFSDMSELLTATARLYALNRANRLPLFIGMDEEGGTVSRLPEGATKLPDARLLGQINDPDLVYWAALIQAQELRALGVNVNFAPVLDVYAPGTNFLYNRSFGTDPDIVSSLGVAFMQGLTEGGVLPVGKHFPGHGATPVDSHFNLPVIRSDMTIVEHRELVPFRAAIAADIPAIMAGHLVFPALDDSGLPATRSKGILTDLLRQKLDFDGLIFTDDLEMGAYMGTASWEEAVVQSVSAGADMLIIAHSYEKQAAAISALRDAVSMGRISMEKLDAAVYRIVRAKLTLNLTYEPLPIDEALSLVGRPQTLAIIAEILRRSRK